jgi:uncharacterized protein
MRVSLVVAASLLASSIVACDAGTRPDAAAARSSYPSSATAATPPPAPSGAACAFDDPAACRRRCDEGDAKSCYRWGRVLSAGMSGFAVDGEGAVAAFRKGCDGGDGDACNAIGVRFREARPPDFTSAFTFMERGCTLGSDKACLNAGAMRHFVDDAKRDVAGAVVLYRRGCEMDGLVAADSCNNLGQIFEGGHGGVDVDRAAARGWYARGCRLGDRQQCGKAKALGASDDEIALTEVAEIAAQQQACDRGNGEECMKLAGRYRKGTGVPLDVARANAMAERACDFEVAESCLNVGLRALRGEDGVALDPARAVVLLRRACDGGLRKGCFQLAERLRLGEGTAIDLPRARALYEKTCAEGSSDGCREAASSWRDPAAGPVDEQRALALLESSCARGDKKSCEALRTAGGAAEAVEGTAKVGKRGDEYWCDGAGEKTHCFNVGVKFMQSDPAKAARYFEQSCAAGHGGACGALAVLLFEGRGVAVDHARGVKLMDVACAADPGVRCENLRKLEAKTR